MKPFPIAAKRPHFITQHGVTRNDEYYWMRERENPEALQYLQAENEYLEEVLGHIQPLRKQLFEEMKGRIKEADETVPEKIGKYLYYKRHETGKQYPIHCRKKDAPDATEEILLDQNQLAEGHEFCSVSAFAISPDGTKLAYSVDLEGAEVYTIYFKDLETGSLYPESIQRTAGSVYFSMGAEWANDNRIIFYVTLDEYHRADKLHRHILGTDPKEDKLIFHEKDDTFSLSMFKTRSERFIMTYHYNTLSQEMRFISPDEPESDLTILQPRQPGHEYYATHQDDSFLIITNDHAPNFRVMKTLISKPGMENWQELIPHREDTLVEHIDAFKDYIVLHERQGGLRQLRVSKPDGVSDIRYVKFPDPTYEAFVDTNFEYDTTRMRLKYSSLVTPYSTVDYHMNSGEWQLLKEDEIPSGYDKSQYVTEYTNATATDGKQVPISIVYKKGLKRDGNNPVMLYGYGAYGGSSEASFNTNIFSILDRGFIFAIGHIRGGAELGRAWYEEGKLFNKKNTFTDFIACAEHLIKEGFTSSQKLAIIGGSAGGLLVGACMVMRPDLFKVVICKVPFLDVVTSMSDPTIPLTTLEYDQWGNPQESKEAFDYMLSYSPYDNIKPVEYPHLLLTTGYNDPRVAYWEPAKFLARIREVKKGDTLAMLQTNFSAGHAGASGRYDFLKENVLDFAFLIDKLGQKTND
ncbi:MAG: S9 family peptidase [Anaerolineales bacterium]|nr:S9 family peptidase [Anaerolineales bacterium]